MFLGGRPGRLGVSYRDLYPEPPPPGMVPSCAEGGVLGIICASVASVMGTEAIKLITGIGETPWPVACTTLEMSYRTITIRRTHRHRRSPSWSTTNSSAAWLLTMPPRRPRFHLTPRELRDNNSAVAGTDRSRSRGVQGHRAYRQAN